MAGFVLHSRQNHAGNRAATDRSSALAITYRFGQFLLDHASGTLTRNGERIRLQDQPFRLLHLLVERAGEVVSREDIRDRLWSQNTFVEFDKSLGVAVLKVREALADEASNPRFIETVPRRGYRFIAPVRVERPTVPDSNPVVGVPSVRETSLPSHAGVQKYRWLAASLVVVLIVAGFYLRSRQQTSASMAPPLVVTQPAVHLRRSVAVLGFRNLPKRAEDDWLSAAVCEMLNTELAAGGELRMVSGEDVATAKGELPVRDEDSLGRSTLQQLRVNPGADVVVIGSYTTLPGGPQRQIRLDVRLQETSGGETIAEEAVSGNESELFGLVGDLGGKLRQRLGATPVSEAGAIAARAAIPSSEKAARLYSEGRAKLWGYDYFAARDLLTKAIAADPKFPLAHAALSDVWSHIGYDAKAVAEARRARELSNNLSEEQRLVVEGQYDRMVQEWPKAIETYRSLFRLFPDNLNYGLLFASAQMHLNPSDSLATLATLRRLPPPYGDDARIDMTEASAWINRDFTKARAASKLAIEKAKAQAAPLIVSRTYGILCQQGPIANASVEAIDDCKSALQGGIAAKDLNTEAMMRTNLAAAYYLRGDLTQSAEMFQEAVKQFRQVGNRDGVATALSNFAETRLSLGDLKEAEKLLKESIPEYQAVDDQEGVALNLDNLGDLYREQGQLQKAGTTYGQAEVLARKIDDKNAIATALTGKGDVAFDRGDLAAARTSYKEALQLRDQTGEKQSSEESRLSIAKVDVEEGHGAEAETVARASMKQFHDEQQADDELSAGIVLIGASLAAGKQSEAEKTVLAAQDLGAHSQNRFLHLQFELASARVQLASNHPEHSSEALRQIKPDAERQGYVGLGLATELALAECAAKTQHPAEAQTRLRELHTAASSAGFGLIARKADQQLSSLGK
jgi:eukaryotic-like serine/threonine-protein kinase